MENIIVSKIIVVTIILAMVSIGSYFGICNLKLRKRKKQLQERNKELQEDMFRIIEEMNELKNTYLELSDTQKKLIFSALAWPAFKKEVKVQGLEDVYEHLKKKIRESIDV